MIDRFKLIFLFLNCFISIVLSTLSNHHNIQRSVRTYTRVDFDADPRPVCDVLHDEAYTIGKWKLMEHDREWKMCTKTSQSMNDFIGRLFCYRNLDIEHATLKPYVWEPSFCKIPFIDAQEFWDNLSQRRLVFIGDSITTQHYFNLRCWLDQIEGLVQFPDRYRLSENITQHENDHSFIEMVHTSFLFPLIDGYLHFDTTDGFQQYIKYGRKVILVVNTGAWFNRFQFSSQNVTGYFHENQYIQASHPGALLRMVWNHFINVILANYRGILIIRSMTPAHTSGCIGQHSALFDWDQFDKHTQMIKDLIKSKKNMFLLNVMPISELRPDGHPGSVGVGEDCFHWCSPGPNSVVNTWTDVLALMLRQMREENIID